MKLGASVTVGFFTAGAKGDLQTPPAGIYRGPCWGYSASVSFTVTGRAAPGSYSCSQYGGCPGYDWDQGATISMLTSTPARFNGSYVLQPHVWSAYNRSKELAEFEPDTCVVGGQNGSGTGSDDGKTAFLVFHSQGLSAFGTWGSAGLPGSQWYSSTGYCGGEKQESEGANSVTLPWCNAWGGPHWNWLHSGQASTPAQRPALQGTVTGSMGGDSVATATYGLTRIEIPRPGALGS